MDRIAATLGLYERIDLYRTHPDWFDPVGGDVWLQRWCDQVARGDEPLFVDRLAYDGLDLASAAAALGALTLPPDLPQPSWAISAAEVAAIDDRQAWLQHGERRVAALLGPSWAGLSDHVRDALMTSLVRRVDTVLTAADPASHPAALRLLAEQIDAWATSVAELLGRWRGDLPDLAACFGGDHSTIEDVDTGLSDAHDGGRTVMRLHFAGAAPLLYKPRALGAEAAFAAFADRLVITPKILCRPGYGWCQHIDRGGPPTDALLTSAGALLAVLHALRVTDFHHGNVIAGEAGLLPIDLETLASPPPKMPLGVEVDEQQIAFEHSVVGTGFLPAGSLPDQSALRAVLESCGGSREHKLDAVLGGFETTYLAAASRRGAAGLQDDCEVRFVPRPTGVYGKVLAASIAPSALLDGRARSTVLDVLARSFVLDDAPPPLWPIIRAEHDALFAGDIPRFTVTANSRRLQVRASGQSAARHLPGEHLGKTPAEVVQAAVHAMGDADLGNQRRIVGEAVLCCDGPVVTAPVTALSIEPADSDHVAIEAAVMAIAEEIARSVMQGGVVVGAELHEDALTVGVLGRSLYAGTDGLALFLAAAASHFCNQAFADAAHALIEPLLEDLRAAPDEVIDILGVGAFQGAGGTLYVLSAMGRWLGEPALVADAVLLADAIDARHLAEAGVDLINGLAGTILTLRAVADQAPQVRDVLRACADVVVSRAVPQSTGLGWPRQTASTLCGMSHGNAGVALALVAAHRLTGVAEHLDVALAAIAYERALRDDDAGNWPDLRTDARPFTTAWCHGAPGIALARAGVVDVIEAAADDLELALATTLRRSDRTIGRNGGHLCCGDAGLDDVVLELGRRLDRPALIARASGRAHARVAQAAATGAWLAHPALHPRSSPLGLMTGRAGIGYGLLRMIAPRFGAVLDLSPPT